MSDTLTLDDLSKLLHLKKRTIYNRISRGGALPPSIKQGAKRIWLRSTVMAWLEEQQEDTTFKY